MEVHGSFHCRWKWKLPLLLPSIAASTNTFRGRFHELPYTPPYFHLLPRVSQTFSCFHKTNPYHNPNPSPKLELPPWKLAYFQLEWKLMEASMEVDGSTWTQFAASMEAGATFMEDRLLPTSMEVGRSFHRSR